jgi:predicted permease
VTLLASIFVSNIVPLLLIAGTGYALSRWVALDPRGLSHLVFYATLPCLVFTLMMAAPEGGQAVERLVVLVILLSIAMGALGYVTARLTGLDQVHLRAFLLVVMFSNTGNFGLPLVRLAYGDAALTYAAIFFLASSIITTIVGPWLAAGARHTWAGALLAVLRLPTLYAMLLAVALRWSGRTLPMPLAEPIDMLGQTALPTMLLILGIQLQRATRPDQPAMAALACALSLIAAPLIALGLTAILGISGPARQAGVTLSAMPSAVATMIFALEFDLAPTFVTSIVFVSTVLSPITVTAVIAYLK